MAKYETVLHGDFGSIVSKLHNEIMNGSISASFEDSSSFSVGGARVEVRVYERYSWSGNNRLSLTITLVGSENNIKLSAITAGGSGGMFFKVNTWGEEAFLDKVKELVEKKLR